MRRIAGRLDYQARQVDAGRPSAFGGERRANRMDAGEHIGKKMRR
jgi:hypothetical protein